MNQPAHHDEIGELFENKEKRLFFGDDPKIMFVDVCWIDRDGLDGLELRHLRKN